jgi:lycopene beta-cyclase
MYTMPLGKEEGFGNGQRIFFEETSLVARPGVSFEDCKRRCLQRLKHLGVTVRPGSITDQEFCYIPMGGSLPEPGQRIVAFGGAAATVHPATGYQLCRMMAGATEIAEALANGITNSTLFDPDATAAAAYEALWSPQNQAQRDFAVFGGEFLMSLDVAALRGWFDGFFRLPEPVWAGFLAGWPTLPGNKNHESWFARISFGFQLLLLIPGPVALRLAAGIAGFTVTYGTSLMRSVTPLFGSPPSYAWSPPVPPEQLGDPAAKSEARAMIAASSSK